MKEGRAAVKRINMEAAGAALNFLYANMRPLHMRKAERNTQSIIPKSIKGMLLFKEDLEMG